MITLKEINLFKDDGSCRRYVCLKEITGMSLMYAFIPEGFVDCNRWIVWNIVNTELINESVK